MIFWWRDQKHKQEKWKTTNGTSKLKALAQQKQLTIWKGNPGSLSRRLMDAQGELRKGTTEDGDAREKATQIAPEWSNEDPQEVNSSGFEDSIISCGLARSQLLSCFFFVFKIFLMWTFFFFLFFSFYLICYNTASSIFLMFLFGHGACGLLSPQPGIEPAPPALAELFYTGPAGKFLPTLLHHMSVLYRPAQTSISAPSYMFLRQEMYLMLLCVQSPGRPTNNR